MLVPLVRSWERCAGMPTYRDIYLEKDEARSQPSLEELLEGSRPTRAVVTDGFDDGQ